MNALAQPYRLFPRNAIGFAFALLTAVAIAPPIQAQDEAEAPASVGPTDPAEFEAWLDGIMAGQLKAYHIAGATVAVVKDGALFFSKGYGYVDVENKTPVDPATSLFRIGSVSKLFVWTSVMQLVEQGKIDLNADVNTYLTDLKIPDRYTKPITMANLMTHTPGFEDHLILLFARDETHMLPLQEILQNEMPKRVRPPGQYASYSNHGSGLAMHIVSEISGVPWETYINENVIGPLGMEHTTFAQPLPTELAGDLSKGYTWAGDRFHEEDFEYVPLGAIGGASASAESMAKFMIAHLQYGRLGEARILEEDTARLMQSELHRHSAAVDPMAHGFITGTRNGLRTVGHGGDTLWFHTELVLIPEHNTGLFVSYNSANGPEARGRFVEEFFDRYYPAPEPEALDAPPGFEERDGKFLGAYRVNRYSHTSVAKIAALMSVITVKSSDDGALLIPFGDDRRWIETGPLTFRSTDSERKIVFRENDRGEITHFFISDLPIVVLEKLPWWDDPKFHLAFTAIPLGLCLLALALWPGRSFLRWRYDTLAPAGERMPVFARPIAWITSAVYLVFFGLIVYIFVAIGQDIVFGVPPIMEYSLWLPLAALALTVCTIAFAVYIWLNALGTVIGRLFYALLCLGFVALLWEINWWRLLGFHY